MDGFNTFTSHLILFFRKLFFKIELSLKQQIFEWVKVYKNNATNLLTTTIIQYFNQTAFIIKYNTFEYKRNQSQQVNFRVLFSNDE